MEAAAAGEEAFLFRLVHAKDEPHELAHAVPVEVGRSVEMTCYLMLFLIRKGERSGAT